MMPLADAAAGCGETIQQFVSRWVKTGVVKPVNMGIRVAIPRLEYVKVQNLRQCRVTAVEEGRLLGMTHRVPAVRTARNTSSVDVFEEISRITSTYRSSWEPRARRRERSDRKVKVPRAS